ncbi:hypothetical protein LTR08_004650 [Meristemomyces frigidus]|nr:hypothetical protein LTR08_004650 [Meristemomyces frigidus]
MKPAALALLAGFATALKAPPYLADYVNEPLTISRLQTQYNPGPLTQLKVTSNVVSLKRANSWSLSSVYLQALRQQHLGTGAERATNGSVDLASVEAGQVFLAPVTVGGQDFYVVVDSGSSDPWLVGEDFDCVDPTTGTTQDDSDCYFGTTYSNTDTTTYSVISPAQNFNISYADGESLTGIMAHESFTMGGITCPHQEFGFVNYAAWYGDGYSSGLIGFAYRTLTSAYLGSNPHADQPGGQQLYNPLFVNMFTNQGVPPVFSLAIDRDPDTGGILALGGLPDVPHSAVFASTPIIPVGVNTSSGSLVYEFYTIVIDGFAYSADLNAQFNPYNNVNPLKTSLTQNGTQAIVDSGTSLLYAAPAVAEAVAGLFNPPGSFDEDNQVWSVPCTAIAPTFGVGVGGKVFYVNALDLMLQASATECISGVQSNGGGSGLTILGDVWMKNVVSVFDIGAEQMRFAARQYYGSENFPVQVST